MSRNIILVLVLLIASVPASKAQLERSAIRSMQKQKWERARMQLHKVLQRDTTSIAGHYGMAIYFFMSKNPDFQLDSVTNHITRSLRYYHQAASKQRERLKHFPVDSMVLLTLKSRVDSAAFCEARRINTEEAFNHFLHYHKNALYQDEAIALRDEAAYFHARRTNTHQGFLNFLTLYPDSKLKDSAKKEYDKLLYEDKTKNKRLDSYEEFLKEFPASPYRTDAERNIFELSTASGKEDSYLEFIARCPANPFIRKAKNIFYYLLLENDPEHIREFLPDDSIANVQFVDRTYMVPFYADGQFGFMDDRGNEIIKIAADSINRQYLCGNITDDFIATSDRVVARNGGVIFKGNVKNVNDIGHGFLEIETVECKSIVHKSGFAVGQDCVQDARILNGKFIALLHHDHWSLWTLSGRKLMSEDWDDVTNVGDVIVFKKDGKFKLATVTQISGLTDGVVLKSQDTFDDVRAWRENMIWARAGDYQGLLDQSLTIRLPFEIHILTSTSAGTISSSSAGRKIYNTTGDESGYFQNITISEPWVGVTFANGWRLFDPVHNRYLSSTFDSITFAGPFSVGHHMDTLRVYFNPETSYEFKNSKLEFIPGKDSTSFLLVETADKKSVYNQKGEKLFTVTFDKIQYAGQNIFIVSKKDKKGLILENGKPLLPLEFDAIGSVNDNSITLLKKLKFGLYDVLHHRQIKPQYDRNLSRYNATLLISFKDGFFGLIDWENTPLSQFEFEEIRYWNDTTAMVRKNLQWMLYDINKKTILVDKIKKYRVVSDTGEEKVFIMNLENDYGVISNKRGTILPFAYNGIKNLGSSEDPLYFTEKHVEEASIVVVVYYTKSGAFIRKQVYDEDDYERIYCQDN